jgi:hypothetical protein
MMRDSMIQYQKDLSLVIYLMTVTKSGWGPTPRACFDATEN